MQIELLGLSKSYGRLAVLKACDLQLQSGQLLCLLGSNGAGKTTLLRVVSGLLSADRGKFFVDGQETLLTSSHWRQQCAFVAHKTFLYQDLTGLENLHFFSSLYQCVLTQEELRRRLGDVGLERAAGKRVRAYSRGMQQRLTIARAMLPEPAVLILDEPFTGLDKDASALLLRMLSSVKERGGMVLMTSHDPQAALPLTDAFARLRRGILEDAVPAEGRSWSELEPLLYPQPTPEAQRA